MSSLLQSLYLKSHLFAVDADMMSSLSTFGMIPCNASTGAGTRNAAVEAVRNLPDLAAVALAHVVDYLRSFQSEGVLQQVSCRQPAEQPALRLRPRHCVCRPIIR